MHLRHKNSIKALLPWSTSLPIRSFMFLPAPQLISSLAGTNLLVQRTYFFPAHKAHIITTVTWYTAITSPHVSFSSFCEYVQRANRKTRNYHPGSFCFWRYLWVCFSNRHRCAVFCESSSFAGNLSNLVHAICIYFCWPLEGKGGGKNPTPLLTLILKISFILVVYRMLMYGIANEMNWSALCCESELMKPKLIYLHYLHEQWQALCYMCRRALHTYDVETVMALVREINKSETPIQCLSYYVWRPHIHFQTYSPTCPLNSSI